MKRWLALTIVLAAAPAYAHIGSPDVFYEGQAGPYRLLVTVRPPQVIPGVADVQIRVADSDVTQLRMVPLPVTGEAAQRPPTADIATRSSEDPQLYHGALWLMEAGSWQVRVLVDGARGPATLGIPVPALPLQTAGMERALQLTLIVLLTLLCAGVVAIAAAAARESTLPPGQLPGAIDRKRSRSAALTAAIVVVGALGFGNAWWNTEANEYAAYTYKPLQLQATVDPDQLQLELRDPGWLRRRLDDWVPDHDHLMHLFVVRLPDLERICHLHPTETGPGRFTQNLPALPAGRYRLFGELVHRSGLGETVFADLDLPAIVGSALQGDDSAGLAPSTVEPARVDAPLSGGAKLIWLRDGELHPGRATSFHFRAVDAAGQPTSDLEPYMGMLGHAAFIARDLSVFAHVHPSGSVSMASLAIVDPHAQHHHEAAAGPSDVSFPYGLPKAGDYRLFVQIKRHGQVETASFDLTVRAQ